MDVLCLFALVREHLLPVQSRYVRQPLCPLCVRVRVDMCACLCVICNNCVCVCVCVASEQCGASNGAPCKLAFSGSHPPSRSPLSHTRSQSVALPSHTLALSGSNGGCLVGSLSWRGLHTRTRSARTSARAEERKERSNRERERERKGTATPVSGFGFRKADEQHGL